ncbi:hypothetical protein [Vibrio parahaemolyticus]|uniref:hypothetical protein n=1 Tax=Vibrio parahaemolyticus TaxID=670 RepID=UPI00296EC8F5|nr:hypothetical protein [Vibrio parahaemolyticus]WOZ64835.1 hypothetical protein RHS39_01970 [Vibrio parahaemolyticus]
MDIGRALHYSLQNNISASVIDRGYVLSQWKNENSFPIDYQLSLFCRRLFHEVWEFYPNFFEWVDRKFIPGLINGEREILVMSDNNQILGYAALKKTLKRKRYVHCT